MENKIATDDPYIYITSKGGNLVVEVTQDGVFDYVFPDIDVPQGCRFGDTIPLPPELADEYDMDFSDPDSLKWVISDFLNETKWASILGKTALNHTLSWSGIENDGDTEYISATGGALTEYFIEVDWNSANLEATLYADGVPVTSTPVRDAGVDITGQNEYVNQAIDKMKEQAEVYEIEKSTGTTFPRDYWGKPITGSKTASKTASTVPYNRTITVGFDGGQDTAYGEVRVNETGHVFWNFDRGGDGETSQPDVDSAIDAAVTLLDAAMEEWKDDVIDAGATVLSDGKSTILWTGGDKLASKKAFINGEDYQGPGLYTFRAWNIEEDRYVFPQQPAARWIEDKLDFEEAAFDNPDWETVAVYYGDGDTPNDPNIRTSSKKIATVIMTDLYNNNPNYYEDMDEAKSAALKKFKKQVPFALQEPVVTEIPRENGIIQINVDTDSTQMSWLVNIDPFKQEAYDDMANNRSASRKTADVEDDYELLHILAEELDDWFNFGRDNDYLRQGDVESQIARMRQIYNRLDMKPEWLTEQDLDDYAHRTGVVTASKTASRPFGELLDVIDNYLFQVYGGAKELDIESDGSIGFVANDGNFIESHIDVNASDRNIISQIKGIMDENGYSPSYTQPIEHLEDPKTYMDWIKSAGTIWDEKTGLVWEGIGFGLFRAFMHGQDYYVGVYDESDGFVWTFGDNNGDTILSGKCNGNTMDEMLMEGINAANEWLFNLDNSFVSGPIVQYCAAVDVPSLSEFEYEDDFYFCDDGNKVYTITGRPFSWRIEDAQGNTIEHSDHSFIGFDTAEDAYNDMVNTRSASRKTAAPYLDWAPYCDTWSAETFMYDFFIDGTSGQYIAVVTGQGYNNQVNFNSEVSATETFATLREAQDYCQAFEDGDRVASRKQAGAFGIDFVIDIAGDPVYSGDSVVNPENGRCFQVTGLNDGMVWFKGEDGGIYNDTLEGFGRTFRLDY